MGIFSGNESSGGFFGGLSDKVGDLGGTISGGLSNANAGIQGLFGGWGAGPASFGGPFGDIAGNGYNTAARGEPGQAGDYGSSLTGPASLLNPWGTPAGGSGNPLVNSYRTAAEQTARGNRPTQNTPWGKTTWTQDANGNWTQDVTLNPAEQEQLDATRAMTKGLLGQAGDAMANPLDYSGFDNPDAGFGAVQEVQDAMMSRLRPSLDRSRESEIQRLRNQGIFENTEAFDRAMTRSDEASTDAEMQALLGATDAYGDIFSRGMNKRQQQIAEANQLRAAPLNDLARLQGTDPSMPEMPSFMAGPDYYGAEVAAQEDARSAANAKSAAKSNKTSGLLGLAAKALPFIL
jgi:hypothetical protein